MGPGQVYRTDKGQLLLYVRREVREHVGEGVLLVGTRDGVVFTRFVQNGTVGPGELVNDTAGRVEAIIEIHAREEVEEERDALLDTLKACKRWLSGQQMDELRDFFKKTLDSFRKGGLS